MLPTGSVEDHGDHLPLDTDNSLIWSICEEAAKRADGDILLLPLIPHGFETHHMDLPGTIDIRQEHLPDCVLDITKSVAHHGFDRILMADGHGSNMPILDLVARRTILETDALCGCFIWPGLASAEINRRRESGRGGMAHGGELETSVYQHLAPDKVQLEKAVKDIGLPASEFIWMDLMDKSPVLVMDEWTRFSKSGTYGDPTIASAGKGRPIFEAVVEAFVRLVREFRDRPRGERTDQRPKRPDFQYPERAGRCGPQSRSMHTRKCLRRGRKPGHLIGARERFRKALSRDPRSHPPLDGGRQDASVFQIGKPRQKFLHLLFCLLTQLSFPLRPDLSLLCSLLGLQPLPRFGEAPVLSLLCPVLSLLTQLSFPLCPLLALPHRQVQAVARQYIQTGLRIPEYRHRHIATLHGPETQLEGLAPKLLAAVPDCVWLQCPIRVLFQRVSFQGHTRRRQAHPDAVSILGRSPCPAQQRESGSHSRTSIRSVTSMPTSCPSISIKASGGSS